MDPQLPSPPELPEISPVNHPALPQPHSRLPILLGSLFLSLLLLGGSYFVFGTKQKVEPTPPVSLPPPTAIPTINETTNWETYTNPAFNFSFKYPKSNVTRQEKTITQNDYMSINDQLSFIITETSIGSCDGLCPKILSVEQETINGNTLTKYTTQQAEDMAWPEGANPRWVFYEIKLSDNLLGQFRVDSLFSESQEYLNNLTTLNQILSTFTFLDSNNSTSELDCNIDSDCGINFCNECKIMNKKYLKPEDQTCLVYCATNPVCYQGKCINNL